MSVLIPFDFSATIDPAHISWELVVFLFPWLHFQSPSSSYYSNVGVLIAFFLGLSSLVLDPHPNQSNILPWLKSVPVTIDYHTISGLISQLDIATHLITWNKKLHFIFYSFLLITILFSSHRVGHLNRSVSSMTVLSNISFSLFPSLLWLNFIFIFSSFD